MRLLINYREWVFLTLAGIAGAWILLSATSVYGAGVSSDSIFYLSSADNFARGKGFFDFKGEALVDFPPLYPFILGTLSWISGITPLVWGRFINAVGMGLLIFSTGWLLSRLFTEQKVWFYTGTLATLLFLPLYTLAANIATDLIYILLSVWFCLAGQAFLKDHSPRWLVSLTLLAAVGALLRWVGLAFVLAEFVLVFIAYRDQLRKAFLLAVLPCGLAALPVLLWVGLRNRAVYGTLGRIQVEPQKVDLLQNLQVSLSRIIAWSAPNPALYCLPVLIVLVIAVLLLSRGKGWRRWLRRFASPPVLPILLLSGIYFLATLATGYSADRTLSYDNRYQAPLYFCILVLLFISLDELVLAPLKGRVKNVVLVLLVGIFGAWGVYQGAQVARFIQVSKAQGVVEYNEYNNKQMVRSGLVVYLLKNPPPAEATLYSNVPEAVYFFLRRPVKMSPVDQSQYTANPEALTVLYPKWPLESSAYLIWFKPNIKRQYYAPDQLERLAVLEKIYKRWDGEVYLINPGN